MQFFNSILYSFFVDEPASPSSGGTKAGIRALQASDGNKLWETPVPSDIAPALEARMNLAIGTITPEGFYLLDGPNLGDLAAWSTQDGKALWQHQSSDSYTSIFADENAVFTASAHGLFAWKAPNGTSLWQQTSPSDIGALLFPSFQEVGGILYGISQNNNNIYAFNPQNGKQVWTVHVNAIHAVVCRDSLRSLRIIFRRCEPTDRPVLPHLFSALHFSPFSEAHPLICAHFAE